MAVWFAALVHFGVRRKCEGNQPMLAVRDCDHVRLFGHGGNAKALPGEALYVVEGTPNFLLASGKVSVTLLQPASGAQENREAAVRDGRLEITLPAFLEDLAVHVRMRPSER
ncbi:MAG: hypothetical protein ACQESR_18305 [Planctomycetota bacterium]